MMRHIRFYLFSIGGTLLAAFPRAVLATSHNPFNVGKKLVTDVGKNAGIASERSFEQIIGQIINVALSFLGIFFLGLMLYGGFRWMNAQGDNEEVKKAKDIIRNAIIGLVVIVAAFAISNFVLSSLVNVTTGT